MNVRNAVRIFATIVSVCTFVLLYLGLVDLSRLAGMYDIRQWLYPFAVDGMVAAGYAATLHPNFRRSDIRYAWAVIILGSGMSFLGQWLHASSVSQWKFAGPVASAPAIGMALVWHLLFLVIKRNDAEEKAAAAAEPVVETPQEQPEELVYQKPSIVRTVEDDLRAVADRPYDRHVLSNDIGARAITVMKKARDEGRALSVNALAAEIGVDDPNVAVRWYKHAMDALSAA